MRSFSDSASVEVFFESVRPRLRFFETFSFVRKIVLFLPVIEIVFNSFGMDSWTEELFYEKKEVCISLGSSINYVTTDRGKGLGSKITWQKHFTLNINRRGGLSYMSKMSIIHLSSSIDTFCDFCDVIYVPFLRVWIISHSKTFDRR